MHAVWCMIVDAKMSPLKKMGLVDVEGAIMKNRAHIVLRRRPESNDSRGRVACGPSPRERQYVQAKKSQRRP